MKLIFMCWYFLKFNTQKIPQRQDSSKSSKKFIQEQTWKIYQKSALKFSSLKKIFSPIKSTYLILKFDQKFIQYVYNIRVKTNSSNNYSKFKLKSCKFQNLILDRFRRTITIHGIEPFSDTTVGFSYGSCITYVAE